MNCVSNFILNSEQNVQSSSKSTEKLVTGTTQSTQNTSSEQRKKQSTNRFVYKFIQT